jgi:hypothetical protein
MKKRTRIIAGLLVGLALPVSLYLALFPKIRTATEAQVRAHASPELLLPLPNPEGGQQRFEAARQAMLDLSGKWQQGRPRNAAASGGPLDLQDPRVRRVIDILAAGPLDRSTEWPASPGWPIMSSRPIASSHPFSSAQFIKFGDGLIAAAQVAAEQGDWQRVGQQMEAAYLLLDRLTASDIAVDQFFYTVAVETAVDKAVLKLSASSGLPATLAARLATLQSVERHSQEQVQRVLRGEFQLRKLGQIQAFPLNYSGGARPWVSMGTYDPIETVALISDSFVEAGRNAGLPASRRSSAATDRIRRLAGSVQLNSRSEVFLVVHAIFNELRLNISRNAMGRRLASYDDPGWVTTRVRAAQTRREQVAAALAVVRFRQRTGRDPHGFDELVTMGLLAAVPLDHAREQPLAFDLAALFQWPAPPPQPATGSY